WGGFRSAPGSPGPARKKKPRINLRIVLDDLPVLPRRLRLLPAHGPIVPADGRGEEAFSGQDHGRRQVGLVGSGPLVHASSVHQSDDPTRSAPQNDGM